MCFIFIFEERFSPSDKPSVDVFAHILFHVFRLLLQSHNVEQLEIVTIPPSDFTETQIITFLKLYWL